MAIEVDAANRGWLPALKEIVAYRDLFITLSYRDLRVRYAQTALGLLWAVFQPLITLLILTLIFGRAVKVDTSGIPYPLFAITGISVWSYFAFVLKESGQSILSNQEMVRKVYFPRLILPLSKAAVGMVDLVVALVMTGVLFLVYQARPNTYLWLAAPYFIGIMATALGVGIWVSALTIRYRDLQHVVPFFVQFGLFISPVAYTAGTVTGGLPVWAQVLYYLNPMAGLIEGFRWSLLGVGDPNGFAWISAFSAVIIFASSFIYFRRMERMAADMI